MSDSMWPRGLYSPWNSLSQNTGVGSLSVLQGIFPTQGFNPGLPHCRQILYQLGYQGSPYWIKMDSKSTVGLPRWPSGKEPAFQCRRHKRLGFDPWVGKIPWSKKWQCTLVLLFGKLPGQKSLAGYRQRGRKESDMTEHACMHTHRIHYDQCPYKEGGIWTQRQKERKPRADQDWSDTAISWGVPALPAPTRS